MSMRSSWYQFSATAAMELRRRHSALKSVKNVQKNSWNLFFTKIKLFLVKIDFTNFFCTFLGILELCMKVIWPIKTNFPWRKSILEDWVSHHWGHGRPNSNWVLCIARELTLGIKILLFEIMEPHQPLARIYGWEDIKM